MSQSRESQDALTPLVNSEDALTTSYTHGPPTTDGRPKQQQPAATASKRLVSLDGLRGLAVVFMILVNYQGTDPYRLLAHADWFGFRAIADQVFPLFLFVAGVAIAFTYKKERSVVKRPLVAKMLKRFVLLFCIGLFLNGFPFTRPGLVQSWRIMGVLQRAAICYIGTTVIYIVGGHSTYGIYYIYPTVIVAVWTCLTFLVYNPACQTRGDLSKQCCTETMFDSALLGAHSYGPFDPEGTLSTLPALLTSWSGLLVGIHIGNQPDRYKLIVRWIVIAAVLSCLAWVLNNWIPIGKPLWTPTFMMLTTALSMTLFATSIYVYDIQNMMVATTRIQHLYSSVLYAFVACGRNSTVIYIVSSLVSSTLRTIKLTSGVSLYQAMQNTMFSSWLPQGLSSLALSLFWTLVLVLPIGIVMDYHRIYIKL
ncbi:hypothetical protein INT43_001446 [Umbelopsis isabellina]|uniref:Heparan-alpha-glucosaminide N-acetyltransferase catalytic domain-containing protein n=1 Tax=Mortierella isabellina TaxID=91625 RepID=A0A8H7PE30_MORIS|nr:hypothetical protein INT43_001446 [Umbelopsis isabellina]